MDEQRQIQENRTKHAPKEFLTFEAHGLQDKLKDTVVFDALHFLQRGDNHGCFLKLYQHGITGKLKDKQVFVELCQVLADQVERNTSSNPNLKYGTRYPRNFLNFMLLARSYGPNSARQYDLMRAQLCGPSPRQLRYSQRLFLVL